MKNQHNLPIYLYACRYQQGNRTRFGGDLCFGRKPTAREERNAKHWVREKTCFMGLEPLHFIGGVYPTLEERKLRNGLLRDPEFNSIDELVERAKYIYTEKGYASGLILSWDGINPPQDEVLILPEDCHSEKEFQAQAKELHMWDKFLRPL